MINAAQAAGAKLKVLLVEDDPSDALLLRQMIASRDCGLIELDSTGTLSGGLEHLGKGDFDLVLLDLNLPDSSGLTTLSSLQQREPFVAVIVLSGREDDEVAIRTLQEGAQDYLVKGQIEGHLLLRAIRYAMERKRAELALDRERQLSRVLEDNIPDRIYFKDTQSRFLRINLAMARLFHLRHPDEAIGKSDFDMFLPEHASQAFDDEARIMQTGQPLMGIVEKETFPDGGIGWAMTSKLPLYDKNHKIIGTFGISRDITELKTVQDKLAEERNRLKTANADLARSQEQLMETLADLRRSHEELKAAQLHLIQAEKMQSLGRLAAGVAHEVKNPLAIVRLGADYLSRVTKPDDQEKAATIQEIKEAVTRADTIIRGLLDFSIPHALDLQHADLDVVIEEALLLVKHEMNDRIVLAKDFAQNLPRLQVDTQKIVQVLVNLLTNAIHSMENGGELTVRTGLRTLEADEEGHNPGSRLPDRFRVGQMVVAIEVLDRGTGVPEETLARVFDPFFTTKPAGKGTGLGLTVAKSIVEMHGGKLMMRNRKGGGAAAVILLRV